MKNKKYAPIEVHEFSETKIGQCTDCGARIEFPGENKCPPCLLCSELLEDMANTNKELNKLKREILDTQKKIHMLNVRLGLDMIEVAEKVARRKERVLKHSWLPPKVEADISSESHD